MKLVALTYRTEGDTRPVAALCRALMDAGDEVTLLADGGTLDSARDLGVPHGALADDIVGQQHFSSFGKEQPKCCRKGARAPDKEEHRHLDAPDSRSGRRLRWADRCRSRCIHRFLRG